MRLAIASIELSGSLCVTVWKKGSLAWANLVQSPNLGTAGRGAVVLAEGVGERDCSRSTTSTSAGRLEGPSAADVTPTTPLALGQPLRTVLQPSDDDSTSTTKLDEKRKEKGASDSEVQSPDGARGRENGLPGDDVVRSR